MDNPFPAATVAAMRHAETEWPNESVGVVTEDGEYVPLANVHPDPATGFEISVEDRLEHADRVACVFHSHCYAKGEYDPETCGPSSGDMALAEEWGCTWGIIPCIDKFAENPLFFGDACLDDPLVGRRFVAQVHDCYELIRSAYHQWYRIDLPSFPRDWGWWNEGLDLYTDGFAKAGFGRIDLGEAMPGDVLIVHLVDECPVPSHAGILLDEGVILHHRLGKLSKRDSVGSWLRANLVVGALRHEAFGDDPPPTPPKPLAPHELAEQSQ